MWYCQQRFSICSSKLNENFVELTFVNDFFEFFFFFGFYLFLYVWLTSWSFHLFDPSRPFVAIGILNQSVTLVYSFFLFVCLFADNRSISVTSPSFPPPHSNGCRTFTLTTTTLCYPRRISITAATLPYLPLKETHLNFSVTSSFSSFRIQ